MAEQVTPIGSLISSPAPLLVSTSAPAPNTAQQPVDTAKQPQDPDQVTLSTAAKPAEGKGPHTPTLDEATKTLRQFLNDLPSNLQFKQDQDTGHLYFKVVNPVTQEVIRQVPSEEVLAMARKLKELSDAGKKAPGVLLDQQG
jgi:flagellar protein FlaG